MTYQERFEGLILRMKKDSNRYNNINIRTNTDEEERIVEICKKFHGENRYAMSGCNIKDNIAPSYAKILLDELESILDKLEW